MRSLKLEIYYPHIRILCILISAHLDELTLPVHGVSSRMYYMLNDMEGKITKIWFANEEDIFSGQKFFDPDW